MAIQAKLEKKEKSKNSKIIVERELSNEQRREQNLRALVAEITRKANQAKSPKLPLGKIASAMSLIPDDIFPDPKNPQHTLKRDFVNVFVILDRRDTLIHENNQNKISRDTSAIQSILSPMQFPQIVDIIWTSFKYINTVDSVLDQNTCDFLIQLIIDHGNSDQVVFSIERVVAKLSKHDYITLKSTVIHFKRISELSRDTSISGLCSIIGPILFKSEIGSSVVDYLGPKTRLSKIVNSEQENFDSMEHLTESVVWERPADEATTFDDEVSRPVPGVRSVPDMELMDEEYYDSMIANQDPAKRKKTSIPTSTALTRAGSTISATKLPLECDSLLGKKDVVLISFFSQIAQSCSGHLLEVLIGKFDDIFSWNSERDIN